MTDTLATICDRRRQTVARAKAKISLADIEASAHEAPPPRGLIDALHARNLAGEAGIIAEIKRASPSAGLIRADFDPAAIARDYAAGGAAALSVLTEPDWFQGDPAHLKAAREAVPLPILRKDFMIDPYQCVEARAMGADCILIIMASVSDAQAAELEAAARDWGMDALIEVHDEAELDRALALEADLIGVNNRNLKTLEVSLETSLRLANRIPPGVLAVSESGIRTSDDVARLRDAGYQAFLVGTSLMKQGDPGKALAELLG